MFHIIANLLKTKGYLLINTKDIWSGNGFEPGHPAWKPVLYH